MAWMAKNTKFCTPILGAMLLTASAGAFFSVTATAVHGQAPAATGLEGTWQGTLAVPSGPKLRIVAKITKGADGKFATTFYSIDQGGTGLVANSTTFQDGNVKIVLDRIGLTYTGKMAADGKSIVGESTQGTPLPLILERATQTTEWTIPEAPKPTPPMDPAAHPTFEVATIKPSKPDEQRKMFTVRGGGKFATVNFSLGELISVAYNLQAKQIVNAPDWMWSEKYDIEAQSDTPGQPNRVQLMDEVQALLGDRFQLKFHHDKKELSALILTVSKTGSKLKPSSGDPKGLPGLFFTGVGKLNVTNAAIIEFTNLMQSAIVDRPVVDQTGLTGKYDFKLNWTPDEAQLAQMGMKQAPPAAETADAPPNLFTAMQEQLGLKLESSKTMVDVIVIDKVEKPSDN